MADMPASLLVLRGAKQGQRLPLGLDKGLLGRNAKCHASNVPLESQPAEKLAALLKILADLARTLELDLLLPKIVAALFELFRQADRAFIILRDDVSGPLIPKVIKTRRGHDEANTRF